MAERITDALRRGAAALDAAGVEAPAREARLLLAAALGMSREALLRDRDAAVPASDYDAMLARRVAREPLALITGHREFWSLDLLVSPATLVPRPETETLIEAALAARADRGAVRRVLDLGTGTGCLLLAALTEFPLAWGVGVDRMPGAAALARDNARRLGLAGRSLFLAGDWAAPLAGRFDLVLSNPPYIAHEAIGALMPEVARHEPASALDGGPDGLDAYRRIVACPARSAGAKAGSRCSSSAPGRRPACGRSRRRRGLQSDPPAPISPAYRAPWRLARLPRKNRLASRASAVSLHRARQGPPNSESVGSRALAPTSIRDMTAARRCGSGCRGRGAARSRRGEAAREPLVHGQFQPDADAQHLPEGGAANRKVLRDRMNNMKRMRGRNHRGGSGGGGGGGIRHHSGNIPLNRNHVFDSNGPDLRLRGTAQQLFEKYLQLGRDATSSGDRVMAEGYFQHAEHYFRIINAINQAQQQGQPNANGQSGGQGQNGQNYPNGQRRPGDSAIGANEDGEAPGTGEQPGAEAREIPIATAPPEG